MSKLLSHNARGPYTVLWGYCLVEFSVAGFGIQFVPLIRIRLWNADPDPATYTLAPKAKSYDDKGIFQRKKYFRVCFMLAIPYKCEKDPQLNKKQKYSLGAEGRPFYLRLNI